METPRKKPRTDEREEIDVVGYFQNVTPMKRSARNSQYFNMTLQTDTDEYRDGVCFMAENLPAIQELAENKSPVRITSMTKVPSKYMVLGNYICGNMDQCAQMYKC